ncbi:MAG: Asp-tRNA(Asn)/Glu-tRNA(Gln) amidotransferase subunit GatC [Fusobacteriota bacterium]
MALTKEEVLKIAELSRLEISDDEVEKYQTQLNDILSYVEQLNEVDTDDVKPLSHAINLKNVLRKDVVKESININDAMKNAPEHEGGAFIVPKVVN